jgi:hypothetical protein
MQILDWITCRRVGRKGFASFFCLVLLSTFTHAIARAQQPSHSAALDNPAHDITMSGSVERVVTTRTAGAPLGIQLVVEGPQGAFTANLGSTLGDKVLQTLSPGTPVQVSGVMQTINGNSYLLARKMTVAGNQVIVRNQHGFLVHSQQRTQTSALYRGAK